MVSKTSMFIRFSRLTTSMSIWQQRHTVKHSEWKHDSIVICIRFMYQETWLSDTKTVHRFFFLSVQIFICHACVYGLENVTESLYIYISVEVFRKSSLRPWNSSIYVNENMCIYNTCIENQRGDWKSWTETHKHIYPNREQHLVQQWGDQYDDGRSNVTQFFVYQEKKKSNREKLRASICWCPFGGRSFLRIIVCVCVVFVWQWWRQFTASWKQQIKVANSLLPRTDRKCMQTWLVIDFGMSFIVEGITICVTCHSFFCCSINAIERK